MGECDNPEDDMKKANDGRPYYGDEEPLPLLWFLMVPEVYVPLALLGCAVVALVALVALVAMVYWAF